MNNLITRAISGTVYVAVIAGAIIAGQYWFFLLTAVLASLAVFELQTVVGLERKGLLPAALSILDATVCIMMAWLPLMSIEAAVIYVGALLMFYFLLRGLGALYDHREHPFRNAAWSVLTVLYIGFPMIALNIIYAYDVPATKWLVLIMFAMIWLNDTGAYCAGSALGRHKMFPRLSPKKSWEGFAGGLLCCVLAGWVAFRCFNTADLELWRWMVLGVVVCLFSTWGDLFESLLKRNAGVKDSGNLIPGHGGILDRIDSLLFVAPACMLFLLLI